MVSVSGSGHCRGLNEYMNSSAVLRRAGFGLERGKLRNIRSCPTTASKTSAWSVMRAGAAGGNAASAASWSRIPATPARRGSATSSAAATMTTATTRTVRASASARAGKRAVTVNQRQPEEGRREICGLLPFDPSDVFLRRSRPARFGCDAGQRNAVIWPFARRTAPRPRRAPPRSPPSPDRCRAPAAPRRDSR